MSSPTGSLRWRCRRGMLELDVMLTRFLDRGYDTLDADGRAAFDRLLDCEDDQLWDWMSGKSPPGEPWVAELLETIRSAR